MNFLPQISVPPDGGKWNACLNKTLLLFPVSFLMAVAAGMFALGIIFFAKNVLGAVPATVGILSASWSVFYVCGCYLFRRLSGIVPQCRIVLASTVLLFICASAIILLESLFWSFVFSVCYGLALSLYWPVVMGWLSAGLEGKKLSRVMGWYSFSWSIGSITSPLIAGWVEDMGSSFSLYGSSIVFLAAASMVSIGISLIPDVRRKVAFSHRQAGTNSPSEKGSYLRYPAWFTAFYMYFMFGLITTVVALAAGDALDITKKTVGLIITARAITLSLSLVFMGQTSWWHFHGRQIAAGAFAGVAVALALVFARSPFLIIFVMLIFGLLVGQGYTNSMFHGVSGATDKAWRMALHEMIINGGIIIGSASGGIAYGVSGLKAAYLVCVAVGLVSLSITLIALKMMRRRELGVNAT